jgi:hypothetical protein
VIGLTKRLKENINKAMGEKDHSAGSSAFSFISNTVDVQTGTRKHFYLQQKYEWTERENV